MCVSLPIFFQQIQAYLISTNIIVLKCTVPHALRTVAVTEKKMKEKPEVKCVFFTD